MKRKTKEDTIKELETALSNIGNLYKSECINWTGKTKDTHELYSEIIANELISKTYKFDDILTITREKTYNRENHGTIGISKSNRFEENFAKKIIGKALEGLGLIKDFQIPLKNTRAEKGLGKIDLLSFNKETKTLYLIELKSEENKETLLRASIESYTYYKIIDRCKLIKDFFQNENSDGIYNCSDINIKPAVLVTNGCNAYNEFKDVELGIRPKLKELATKLDIKYFTV